MMRAGAGRGRSFATLLTFYLAACVTVPRAGADSETKVVRLVPAKMDGQLVCELLLGDLFSPPVESTLRSGLPVIIDLACEVQAEGSNRGIAQLARSEVHYDVWEDRYSLIRSGRSSEYESFEAVHNACRRWRSFPLAPLSALGSAASFRLRVRVAVNPLSGEERERMARWLAETVTDPGDPSSRELRLDLGGLIQNFFRGADSKQDWGDESLFGPFRLADLPLLAETEEEAANELSTENPEGERP